MNTHILLLGVFLCIVAVNARHTDSLENSDHYDPSNSGKAKENGGERHRRKRYHVNYGYDYHQPANPFYNPYRKQYDRNQDLLPEIYRLLDEISSYIRRPPPPPPQPIYIPYAVPYPMCNCGTNTNTPTKDDTPAIASRFPDMDDTNQNWGIVDDGNVEDEGDGSRPISFTPIQPKRPMKRPQVSVEHGSQHARAPATAAPSFTQHIPDMCDVFSLSCCIGDASQQKRCFTEAGCANTYNQGNACDQGRLKNIIEEYSRAYAPAAN